MSTYIMVPKSSIQLNIRVQLCHNKFQMDDVLASGHYLSISFS
jgi:hypothetical protein